MQQNTSDLSRQRFSSTFTGGEDFLAEERGQRVFPQVAYLEMARAAIGAAATKQAAGGIRLQDVSWAQPAVIGEQPLQIHIELYPEADNQVGYEIYTGDDGMILSQGSGVIGLNSALPELNLRAIQAGSTRSLTADQLYETLAQAGIAYEPNRHLIEALYVGNGQILAKITLPETPWEEKYGLQPQVMEGALQAVTGWMLSIKEPNPFQLLSLAGLEVAGECSSRMWALVRTGKNQTVDIDLADASGKVMVRLSGLAIGETEAMEPVRPKVDEAYELMTFEEAWQEQEIVAAAVEIKTMVCLLSDPQNQQAAREAVQSLDRDTKLIFIGQGDKPGENYHINRSEKESYRETLEKIREEHGAIDGILYLWPVEDASCRSDYSGIVHLLQAIAATKLKVRRILLGAPFKNGLERCYVESWIGFERSLGIIMATTQVAAVYQGEQQTTKTKDWIEKLWAELKTPKAQSALYQNGKRYTYQVRPTSLATSPSPVKAGATYLITGGCGGLGYLFAEYMAKQAPVKLILNGRSALDGKKEAKLKALEKLGSQVIYIQADVSDAPALKAGITEAKERFGKITGVIHAAGLPEEKNIFEKDYQRFQTILDPKIKGAQVLDEILEAEPEFICYFSSTAAIIGDFGSCDYAVANRFLMAYAKYRNQAAKGKAYAINWPLWKDGGMGFGDDENTKMYLKSSGQRALEAAEGLSLFEQVLAQKGSGQMVFMGQPGRVRRFLGLSQDQPGPETSDNYLGAEVSQKKSGGRRPEMKGLTVSQCLEWDLKQLIYRLLKIPREKIERDANLADFGFNSISLTQFAILLNRHYGIETITPALFFRYSTLARLSQYYFS